MTWDTNIINQSIGPVTVNGASLAPGSSTLLRASHDIVIAGAAGTVHLTEPGSDNFHQYIPTTWAVKVISGTYMRYWGYEGDPTLPITINANGTFTLPDSCGISFTQIPIDGPPVAQYAGIYFTNTEFWGNIFSPLVINDNGTLTMGNDSVPLNYTYDILHNTLIIPWQPYHDTTFTLWFNFSGSGSNTTLSGTCNPRPQDGGVWFVGSFQSRYEYSLDILSASYGTFVVTSQVQQLYQQAVLSSPYSNIFSITPSTTLFGDPLPGQQKCFTMVWRVTLNSANGSVTDSQIYSSPAVATCIDGNTLNLNYDGTNLSPYTEPVNPPHGLYILGAAFWATDVTSTVNGLVSSTGSGPLVAPATKAEFPNQPYGTTSQLAITYGYLLPDGAYQYNCKTAWEGTNLTIPVGPAPPRLLIQWADYGGVEFTDQIDALTTFDQSLTLDMSNAVSKYGWTDPWLGVKKSLSILYQWEGRPLELLVAVDQGGTYVLDPTVPVPADRTLFFNPESARNAGELNIITITWGAMQGQTKPVSSAIFDSTKEFSTFTPSNTYFGFDGLPGSQKTACVFFQYGITGQIQCTSARENDAAPPQAMLAERSVEFGDPLPAKKLLANFDADRMQGFKLKALKVAQYVGVRLNPTAAGGPAVGTLTLTDDPNQAGIFNIVRLVDGDRLPVLQVTVNQNAPLYVVNINNIACLVSDSSVATEIHYELPGISASTSILLSFVSTSMQEDALVLTPNLATGQVDDIVIFSGPISQSLMEFSWIINQGIQDMPQPNLLQPKFGSESGLLPCTIANFKLLKDMLWDLPTLIAGQPPLNTDRFIQGITKWFNNLTKNLQTQVSKLITGLWLSLQKLVGPGSGASGGSMGKIWPLAVKTMKDFYDSGALWSFYGAISKTLSWFDYLLIVGNLLKWALMIVGTPVIPAAPAVFYATEATCWLIHTTQDILSVIKACSPAGISSAASRALATLARSVQTAIQTSHSFAKLNVLEQSDVVNALLNPHWTRISLGGQITPPAAHLSAPLKGLLGTPGVPSDPALHDFLKHEYKLTSAAAGTVIELRPQIEKDLIGLEQPIAASLLTGSPLTGPPSKIPPPPITTPAKVASAQVVKASNANKNQAVVASVREIET